MMEDPKHPEPESPEPVRPPILDYRGKGSARGERSTTGGAIVAGSVCWLGAFFLAVVFGQAARSVWAGAGVLVVTLTISFITLGREMGMRGFIPGVLIGFSLTCLLPIGIVEVVCGGFRI